MNNVELKREIINKIVPEPELQTLEVAEFAEECINMIRLYAKKNHDYGNSFTQGMNTIGPAYGVGRLYDKMNRIITLTKVKAEVTDEAIQDTVRDLACYSVMTSVYLNRIEEKYKEQKIEDVDFEGTQSTISSTGE